MGAKIGNNYAGRAKELRSLLKRAYDEIDRDESLPVGTTQFMLVKALVMDALTGDKGERRDVLDRQYGKATQTTELGEDSQESIRRLFING